ncbi:hypothetical protein AGMMS50268_31310 [Spirochaetia bacterium]|nr:hypothetical protein AGMMS50268_31310 [Spirochaetia bacterium]
MVKRQFIGILIAVLSGTIFSACDIFGMDKEEDRSLYNAILFGTAEDVEALLIKGHSPDYMNGPIEWVDTNPLWGLYFNAKDDEKVKILIKYKANVTTRPYLGHMLARSILSTRLDAEMKQNYFTLGVRILEKDAYNTAKLFLDAGASPNLKGWSGEPKVSNPTDEKCLAWYEEHGNTPINYAIRLNLFSIVDLLLEHGAVLDAESLSYAAQATTNSGGNTEMQVKIQAIWNGLPY